MDNPIRRAEYRAIYSYPSFKRYSTMALPPIRLVANNGHVPLEGMVANQADKTAADIRAKSLPNVFSVTDNLQVEQQGRKAGSEGSCKRGGVAERRRPPDFNPANSLLRRAGNIQPQSGLK